MILKTEVHGKSSFIASTSGTIREDYGDIRYIMKRKGKTICSLLGQEVAHGSTVDEDLDGSMVKSSFEGQGFLGKGFAEAAEFEGIRGSGENLVFGPGIQREIWCNRALNRQSPGGLQFPGDYSFPDSSDSGVSIALILGGR